MGRGTDFKLAGGRKFYGVPSTFGLIPGRVAYIIDKQGIVRHIFSSQFAPQMHVSEALKVLKQLSEEHQTL
jgi:peroxiredoxin Q/BCP